MNGSSTPFDWPVRVYYEDTDAGGVVYHTGYIRYCERARTEWVRQLGYGQRELAAAAGVLFTVVSLSAHYHAPARLDDLLVVRSVATVAGGASVSFAQQVLRDGVLLASVDVRVACVDATTLRPRRIPEPLRKEMTA